MGDESTTLLRAIRETIERVQAAPKPAHDERAMSRALAHLWSAYDELMLIARVAAPKIKAA